MRAVARSDTPSTITADGANVTPSARQLTWRRMGQAAFIHVGVNTYDSSQWRTGTDGPASSVPLVSP